MVNIMDKIKTMNIISNIQLTQDIYKMILEVDTSFITNPGQFINITIDNKYLKRPISISDYTDNSLTIIYKVVGKGTKILSNKIKGETIEALVGLGNGFTIKDNKEVLLVGGGVGIPPLYNLAKQLINNNTKVNVLLGFNTINDIFYDKEFKELGCTVYITTIDGSKGIKGHIGNGLQEYNLTNLYYYSCGPKPMLKALTQISNNQGQLSFEARMGCGFGACMGCSIEVKDGYKRICKEGPIFSSEEILWID